MIFLVQTNKIIVYSLSIDIRIMTGFSIIITGISIDIPFQTNKIIVHPLTMDDMIMTGWSIIIIASYNDTMTFLVQSNKIIAYTISMNVRMIIPWSVNAIALSQNDIMMCLDIACSGN